MAWRPPKRVWVKRQWIEIKLITQAQLQDLLADDPETKFDGGWDGDDTIYLLRGQSSGALNDAYWHEISHMLIDIRDTPR